MDFDEDADYLDLDDILAQTQPVSCKFLLNIPGLEFLSPANSQDADQGAEFLLPFWMAKTLYTYSMVDVELPNAYKENFREVLQAEADVVDLHRHGPYYYRFGKLLMELKREKGNNSDVFLFRREEGETLGDRKEIATSLINAFHLRRHKLIEYSTNPSASEKYKNFSTFHSRLDNMEKRLFQLGRQQVQELSKWNGRKV